MRSRDYVISRFNDPNHKPQSTPMTSARRRNFPTTADWERDVVSASSSTANGQLAAPSHGSQAVPVQTLSVTSASVESKKLL